MRNKSFNLVNANVITLDPSYPKAESIYIKNGKIESLNQQKHGIETIDLKGATIVPGFIDAHYHLANLGKFLENLNLTGLNSPQKIIYHIKLYQDRRRRIIYPIAI